MVHVARDFDCEEDAGEADHEDAGLPRPHIETKSDARSRSVRSGPLERVPVAVDDELPDRRLALGDREGHKEREDGQTLEEDLGRAVVWKPDEAVVEECPREEREDDGSGERGEPVNEPPGNEKGRNRNERPHNGRHDEHDLFRAAHDRPGDPDADGHDVIPEGAKLTGGPADREARPHVKGERARPVFEEVTRLAEVVPRVVAAEVHFSVPYEVAVRPEARP